MNLFKLIIGEKGRAESTAQGLTGMTVSSQSYLLVKIIIFYESLGKSNYDFRSLLWANPGEMPGLPMAVI
jgi:hypothetical protein